MADTRFIASYGNPSQFYHNLKRKLCYNINIRLPSTDGRLGASETYAEVKIFGLLAICAILNFEPLWDRDGVLRQR